MAHGTWHTATGSRSDWTGPLLHHAPVCRYVIVWSKPAFVGSATAGRGGRRPAPARPPPRPAVREKEAAQITDRSAESRGQPKPSKLKAAEEKLKKTSASSQSLVTQLHGPLQIKLNQSQKKSAKTGTKPQQEVWPSSRSSNRARSADTRHGHGLATGKKPTDHACCSVGVRPRV